MSTIDSENISKPEAQTKVRHKPAKKEKVVKKSPKAKSPVAKLSFGNGDRGSIASMQDNLSEEEVQMVVKALNHYYAYLVATSRDDGRYKELAERIQRNLAVPYNGKATDNEEHSIGSAMKSILSGSAHEQGSSGMSARSA